MTTTTVERIWLAVGFLGQGLFTARFLVQWVASEKKRDSVIPVAFWWLSLAGGGTIFTYAVYRRDPVFMIGQGMGLIVYVRNLMLIGKRRRRAEKLRRRAEMAMASTSAPASGPSSSIPAGGPHLRIDAPAHAR